MRLRTVLLALSLSVNLVAGAGLLLRTSRSESVGAISSQRTAAKPSPTPKATPAREAAPAPRPGTTNPLDAPPSLPLWPALESEDLATLRDRLRAAGFPDEMVRAIITARLNEAYSPRIAASQGASVDDAYWVPALKPSAVNSNESARLMQESNALREELLGADSYSNPSWLARMGHQYGGIASDRLPEALNALNEYRIAQSARRGPTMMLPPDPEVEKAAEEAYRARLAELLSPEEQFEFEMRSSSLGINLPRVLEPFQPSETEFRTVYAAYADLLAQNPAWSRSGNTNSMTQAEFDAKMAMVDGVAATLGEERAADLRQLFNPADQRENEIVGRLGLPLSTATELGSLRDEAQALLAEHRGAATPGVAAPVTPLPERAGEIVAEVSALLGEEGATLYRNSFGRWINDLVPDDGG